MLEYILVSYRLMDTNRSKVVKDFNGDINVGTGQFGQTVFGTIDVSTKPLVYMDPSNNDFVDLFHRYFIEAINGDLTIILPHVNTDNLNINYVQIGWSVHFRNNGSSNNIIIKEPSLDQTVITLSPGQELILICQEDGGSNQDVWKTMYDYKSYIDSEVTTLSNNISNIDNSKNYLGSNVATPPNGATNPSDYPNPITGDQYINGSTGESYVYNGTTWDLLPQNNCFDSIKTDNILELTNNNGITIQNNVNITDTTVSTDCTTGSLVINGGLGVAGKINVCDSICLGNGVNLFQFLINQYGNLEIQAINGNTTTVVGKFPFSSCLPQAINVAIVVDVSGSIILPQFGGDPGNPALIRDGVKQIIDALSFSSAKVALIKFATSATLITDYVDIQNDAQVQNIFSIIDTDLADNQFGSSTNYEAALRVVRDDLSLSTNFVIFYSDGDATASLSGGNNHLGNALDEADTIRATSKIIGMALGSNISINDFVQILGDTPGQDGNTLNDDYYVITQFSDLDDITRDLVFEGFC